jgi:hypothetical protein
MSKLIDNDNITLSIRDGLFLPFMYKGHQVVAHNSSWTFREKIWVDDELVVSKVGVSMTSTHIVEVAGDKLTITFGYGNKMTEIFLTAHAGNELVHEVRHQAGEEFKPLGIATAIIIGAIIGYTAIRLFGGS